MAESLDSASSPVDVDAIVRGDTILKSRRWRSAPVLGASAAAAAVLLVGVVLTVSWWGDGDDLTVGGGGPDSPTTTTPRGDAAGVGTYQGTPYSDLPNRGVAVRRGDGAALLGFDGTELGTASALPTAGEESAAGRTALVVRPGGNVDLVDPDVAEAPDGCGEAAGAGGLRVAVCDDDAREGSHIVAVAPTGEATTLVAGVPDSDADVAWRWAVPSDDGRWVLAESTGGCGVATTFLIAADGRQARPVGGGSEFEVDDTEGIGWTPDGQAVVHVGGAGCQDSTESTGIQLVDPGSGEGTTLYTLGEGEGTVLPWERRAYASEAEEVIFTAFDELNLERCCGEPSHGAPGATTGARWQEFDVPIAASPTDDPPFVPFNDLVIDSAPAEIAGAPVTEGEADLGPFAAFTCGSRVWTFGGAGAGDRVDASVIRELVESVLPRLYCTVGERPAATGHT